MGATATPKSYQFQVRGCNGVNCSAYALGVKFATTAFDESDTKNVSYGGTWTASTKLTGAMGGTVKAASTSKDKAQLTKTTWTVSGSLAWVSTMGPDRGKATVSVDGGAAVTVDLYSPTVKPASVVWTQNFAAGSAHAVVVQVLGTRNGASTATNVDNDGFVALK
jgi:hypothetical protein